MLTVFLIFIPPAKRNESFNITNTLGDGVAT